MKNTVNLKNIYTEQLTKLQQKHQHECELLEDLRLFAKQRSIIEKEYAQSLSKLAQQYLTKRTPVPPPSLASQEGNREQKTMHEVWQTLLEETDRVGKTRILAADVYSQHISDSCKLVRSVKVQVAKKVFENLVDIQKDLTANIQELTKLQKVYRDDEHVTHDARIKASDAEDKVKKKSVGLFTSMSKLQQQSAKLNSRREACEVKSTASRNEYLLSMAAVNAHLNRYYTKDAPELIKAMDGEIYEKMQEYFTAFCQAELQSCGITQECFMRILADSTKVNRDFQLRGFLQDNPIFTDLIQYQFQPQDNDPTTQVSTDHQNLSQMESETKRCASRFVHEDRALRQATKKLQRLLDQASPSNKGQDQESSTSVADPQVKCEEIKQVVRKAGIERTKMEARLESLRKAGINVDVYVSAARSETKTPEDEEEPGHVTPVAAQQSNPVGDAEPTITNINSNQKSEEVPSSYTGNDDTADSQRNSNNYKDETPTEWDDSPPQQQHQQVAPMFPAGQTFVDEIPQHVEEIAEAGQPSVALYSFQASASNELNINEGEELEALGEAGDGWIRARNKAGQAGLVPASYIQIGSLPPDHSISPPTHKYANPSATTTTTTVTSSLEHNGDFYQTPGPEEEPEVNGPTGNGPQTSYSTSDYEVQAALTTAPLLPTSEGTWARAMYDYYATCDEELSFPEGQLIQILRKELHDGVDDGWWEGECSGRVGVFPSLVVEELDSEGKSLDSPQRPGPPEFSPPPPDSLVSFPQSHPSNPPQPPPYEQSPPTPPPPLNPQLEITIPTPEGGKATSELLQDYEERTRLEEDEKQEENKEEDPTKGTQNGKSMTVDDDDGSGSGNDDDDNANQQTKEVEMNVDGTEVLSESSDETPDLC